MEGARPALARREGFPDLGPEQIPNDETVAEDDKQVQEQAKWLLVQQGRNQAGQGRERC